MSGTAAPSNSRRSEFAIARDMWIRAEGAFEPIVDRPLFDAAQAIIRERSHKLSDEEMLEALQQLLQDRGYLSGLVIDETERLPSSSAYQSRFGSLLRAYELVGFTPDRDYRYIEINRALRRMHPQIVADMIAGIEKAGGWVKQDPATDLLTINGEFTASIVVVRCRTTRLVRFAGKSASTSACGRTSPWPFGWTSRTRVRSTITSCLGST